MDTEVSVVSLYQMEDMRTSGTDRIQTWILLVANSMRDVTHHIWVNLPLSPTLFDPYKL